MIFCFYGIVIFCPSKTVSASGGVQPVPLISYWYRIRSIIMLLCSCVIVFKVRGSKTVHASGGEQQLVPLVSYAVAWQNVSAADAFPYDNALKYMSATMHI